MSSNKQSFIGICTSFFAWSAIIFLLAILTAIVYVIIATASSLVQADELANNKHYYKVLHCLEDKNNKIRYGIPYCNACYNCNIINNISDGASTSKFRKYIKQHLVSHEEYQKIMSETMYISPTPCYNIIIETENE